MSPEEVEAIRSKVVANHDRLDKCSGPHEFVGVEGSKTVLGFVRYVCRRCGGDVDFQAQLWYERGLKDGKAKGDGA